MGKRKQQARIKRMERKLDAMRQRVVRMKARYEYVMAAVHRLDDKLRWERISK